METIRIVPSGCAVAACLIAVTSVGCSREPTTNASVNAQALQAECVSADAGVPADAWLCPDAIAVECGPEANDATLYVPDDLGSGCDGQALSVSDPGPFVAGTHTIVVRDEAGDALCSAELQVSDTQAPTTTSEVVVLWPPNHKFHAIAVHDCVRAYDACDGELVGEFVWASSDEPQDDIGDGHHEPDILFDDCGHVQVRAERQGPKDGRVYKLGVRFTDASGHSTEGECSVVVDHDQRGVSASASDEAYRIVLDGTAGTPACDGIVTPPDAGAPSEEDAGDPGDQQPPEAVDAGSPF